MNTQHNLTYLDGYDDEAHDRYIEYTVDYNYTPGYMDSVDSTGINDFPVGPEIYVNSVRLSYIEFFEPTTGRTIAQVYRMGIPKSTRDVIEQQIRDRVDADILALGPLSEELAENATHQHEGDNW